MISIIGFFRHFGHDHFFTDDTDMIGGKKMIVSVANRSKMILDKDFYNELSKKVVSIVFFLVTYVSI